MTVVEGDQRAPFSIATTPRCRGGRYFEFILKTFSYIFNGSPMVRETRVQSQVPSYQRLKKMVLDISLLNTQHYKVRIKGKVEQSLRISSALPYALV